VSEDHSLSHLFAGNHLAAASLAKMKIFPPGWPGKPEEEEGGQHSRGKRLYLLQTPKRRTIPRLGRETSFISAQFIAPRIFSPLFFLSPASLGT